MDGNVQSELREVAKEFRELRSPAIGEARMAVLGGSAGDWLPFVVWMIAPGFVLALIGPFGSFGAPLLQRLLYWMPTMAAGAALGFAAHGALVRFMPSLPSRPVAMAAVHSAIVAAAMTFVVWAWGWIVFGPGEVRLTPQLFFYVSVVTAAISFLRIASGARERPRELRATPDIPPAAGPKLARRLSPGRRTATIYALEAEDHYVRVRTSHGSELLLMRLSDAIEEAEGIEGFRAHRSWWIADAGVARARRENGRTVLTLEDGVEAPVSRAAASAASRFLELKA